MSQNEEILELFNTLIFTALNNINTINTSTLQSFLTCLQGSQIQVEICNIPTLERQNLTNSSREQICSSKYTCNSVGIHDTHIYIKP